MGHWEKKAALWLSPMSAKTRQRLASETKRRELLEEDEFLEKNNNLLSSETMLLERAARLEQVRRAARLEQVSTQKNIVLARNTVCTP